MFLVQTLAPSLANGIVVLFVALLVAGLFMVPFVIPFIDRKAKQDLAAYRAQQGTADDPDEAPGPSAASARPPARRVAAGSRAGLRDLGRLRSLGLGRLRLLGRLCLLVHRRVLHVTWVGVSGTIMNPGDQRHAFGTTAGR